MYGSREEMIVYLQAVAKVGVCNPRLKDWSYKSLAESMEVDGAPFRGHPLEDDKNFKVLIKMSDQTSLTSMERECTRCLNSVTFLDLACWHGLLEERFGNIICFLHHVTIDPRSKRRDNLFQMDGPSPRTSPV
jgi:hypothetical protein